MQDSTAESVVQSVMEVATRELEELVRWLVSNRGADLGKLEQGLVESGNPLLMSLLGHVVESSPAASPWRERECVRCGRRMRALGNLPKWLHTSLGHYQLKRARYHCKHCHNTFAPLDQQLGIDQSGRSPRLVERIALLGTQLPSFEQAGMDLSRLCPDVEVSTSQIQEVTEAVGRCKGQELLADVQAAWQEPYQERVLPEVESRSSQLIISLDGVMALEREGYHKVRTAAVTGCELGEQFMHWRYVIHTEDVETFGRLVWCEAWRQGLETAQLVVVVGDGAEWIWKLRRWHFPEAVQILDLWHVTERLWSAGRAMLGETTEGLAGWVRQSKQRLLEGQVLELLRE